MPRTAKPRRRARRKDWYGLVELRLFADPKDEQLLQMLALRLSIDDSYAPTLREEIIEKARHIGSPRSLLVERLMKARKKRGLPSEETLTEPSEGIPTCDEKTTRG